MSPGAIGGLRRSKISGQNVYFEGEIGRSIEPDKVRFTLSEPYAPFDRQVSLISIVPRKAFEDMGAAQFALTPVGAGPFKVVAWKKDDRVELEAFAGYWGGAPKIKKLVFKPVPSESARAAALASGELDVVPILPPALVDSLGSRQGLTVKRVESNKVVYLGFDVNNPLLSDVRVRKAIDMAVDRNAISQRLAARTRKAVRSGDRAGDVRICEQHQTDGIRRQAGQGASRRRRPTRVRRSYFNIRPTIWLLAKRWLRLSQTIWGISASMSSFRVWNILPSSRFGQTES
jgi:hypothetical protein